MGTYDKAPFISHLLYSVHDPHGTFFVTPMMIPFMGGGGEGEKCLSSTEMSVKFSVEEMYSLLALTNTVGKIHIF